MPSKFRSPNFPQVPLSKALVMAEQLWKKEERTAVPPEIAVRAFGFGALSGPARGAISALRKYGLLESTSGGAKLSDLAVRILHSATAADKQAAVREAALKPELFRRLSTSHAQASDDALRAHLIGQQKFTTRGAEAFVESFRDALRLAGPTQVDNDSGDQPSDPESQPTATASTTAPTQSEQCCEQVFRWPLSRGVTAEVRLTGEEIEPNHLERLREYLALAKAAFSSDEFESE